MFIKLAPILLFVDITVVLVDSVCRTFSLSHFSFGASCSTVNVGSCAQRSDSEVYTRMAGSYSALGLMALLPVHNVRCTQQLMCSAGNNKFRPTEQWLCEHKWKATRLRRDTRGVFQEFLAIWDYTLYFRISVCLMLNSDEVNWDKMQWKITRVYLVRQAVKLLLVANSCYTFSPSTTDNVYNLDAVTNW